MTLGIEEADYQVWRKYLELKGDRAMVARLDVMWALEESGCDTSLKLPDGSESRAPIIVAAEAAVAALEGTSEAEWRQQWTRRLVRLAVKWQDELTTTGVVNLLNATDTVIRSLKGSGAWPWGGEPAQGSEEIIEPEQ
ncbi:MAG: hypothetical protein R6X33_00580 [Candidatus Brocadiia bacterium]